MNTFTLLLVVMLFNLPHQGYVVETQFESNHECQMAAVQFRRYFIRLDEVKTVKAYCMEGHTL